MLWDSTFISYSVLDCNITTTPKPGNSLFTTSILLLMKPHYDSYANDYANEANAKVRSAR